MSAKQTVRDRPPRVLVVEDDPAVAKMLRVSLCERAWGWVSWLGGVPAFAR